MMGVDEAGVDCTPIDVALHRTRRCAAHALARADGGDPAVGKADRLGDGPAFVHRVDDRVVQDQSVERDQPR